MKKELPHYYIGSSYGGNQEWFNGFMMRIGGCAAETAMECCIYLDRNFNTALCPFDAKNITKRDFVKFGDVMKPYLTPRWSGIDSLSVFIDGFSDYLKSRNSGIKLSPVYEDKPYETLKNTLVSQIDRGIPVPFLNLHNPNPRFKDYEWHWFMINGYELFEDELMVKAVTYSSWEWLDFSELVSPRYSKRGGIVKIEI